jgi:hypothetical protein
VVCGVSAHCISQTQEKAVPALALPYRKCSLTAAGVTDSRTCCFNVMKIERTAKYACSTGPKAHQAVIVGHEESDHQGPVCVYTPGTSVRIYGTALSSGLGAAGTGDPKN